MAIYTLRNIDLIEGKHQLFKLSIDDSCQFDEYVDELEKKQQYVDELTSIFSLMEDVSNDKLLPKTKFRDITLHAKDRNKEYEFKSKHLRVYAMKGQDGKIVILGGYKNNQKNDIRKFRATKNEYIKTLKV